MNKQLKQFLLETFPQRSYHAVLQIFLHKQMEKGLSPHTLARQFYNLHPILDTDPVNTCTRNLLKTHIHTLHQRYAPDTVRTAVGDIRQFFKWCKKKGWTNNNLARNIKPIRRRMQRRRKSKAPAEETILTLMRQMARPLKRLLFKNVFGILSSDLTDSTTWNYQNTIQLRDLFIITFIYETGARGGELAALGSAAMDAATTKPAAVYMITVYGKTNDQDYFFTSATAELWHIWQQVRPESAGRSAIVSWRQGRHPQPATTNTISQMLIRRCHQHGLPPFRAHSLRHAKTRRSRKLVGIELASFLIGHTNYDTTIGYDFVDDAELEAAVKATCLKTNIWAKSDLI